MPHLRRYGGPMQCINHIDSQIPTPDIGLFTSAEPSIMSTSTQRCNAHHFFNALQGHSFTQQPGILRREGQKKQVFAFFIHCKFSPIFGLSSFKASNRLFFGGTSSPKKFAVSEVRLEDMRPTRQSRAERAQLNLLKSGLPLCLPPQPLWFYCSFATPHFSKIKCNRPVYSASISFWAVPRLRLAW